MENNMCSANPETAQIRVEQDLLAALFNAEGIQVRWQSDVVLAEEDIQVDENPQAQISYVWNPLAPEAESFFTQLETPSIFEGWQEEEITNRAQSFFAHLNQLWPTNSLQAILADRFAARVPQHFLAAIAEQAQKALANVQQTVSSSLSMADQLADQLVQCVQEITPNLATEDLQVLARPLAYQMRNGGLQDAINTTLSHVPQIEWDKLSEVQQARLSLAIARFALNELQSHPEA